ncbi:chemerin-like receptor 1 [Dendropsophus ebraccatus]|uniref:chemerin-like receptor 1 n=1 Tax=Dendropsophus ebraccatus TaxID=150705 RepID=UPI003831D302
MESTTVFDTLVNATHYTQYTDHTNTYSVTESNLQGNNHTPNLYEVISIMVVNSAFCLLGIIGNGLVIWFGIFRMKKTVNMVWFLSLAMADFFFAFFFPLGSTYILLPNGLFKKIMCKLTNVFVYMNVVISVLQITVISVDRCLCIMFPVWCQNQRRPRLAYTIVQTIWMISFAVAIPVIIHTDTTDGNNKTLCDLTIDDASFMTTTILEFVFLFLLPFITIISCYIVIFLLIRRRRIVTSSRPLKTSMAVIIAFFICWFPSNLFFLLSEFDSRNIDFDKLYYGYIIADFLMVINSCINPILYVFIGRNFKEKVCSSFLAKIEKAFTEEDKSERSIALQRSHECVEVI